MKWILAAMLWLQPPGASLYSKQVAAKDDPPPCSNKYAPMCKGPRWSTWHKAYVIAEQWDTGLHRYHTIAKVVAAETDGKPKLRKIILTSLYHESGFREDIHSGLGPMSRGDCKLDKKGRVIQGTCRSHCLGQLLGRKYSKLPGVDKASTTRCVRKSIELTNNAAKVCGGMSPACIFKIYTGATKKSHPGVKARVKTYYRLNGGKVPPLTDRVKEELGL